MIIPNSLPLIYSRAKLAIRDTSSRMDSSSDPSGVIYVITVKYLQHDGTYSHEVHSAWQEMEEANIVFKEIADIADLRSDSRLFVPAGRADGFAVERLIDGEYKCQAFYQLIPRTLTDEPIDQASPF